MALGTIDSSQRSAAKVVGVAYLVTFVAVVYTRYGILGRLLTDNAADTARNILAQEQLFRAGIAGYLFYCVSLIVLVTALYVVLRPVSRGFALLAALWWLVWVFMWLGITLNLFDALRLIHGADSLQAFGPERLQAVASFYLHRCFDYYYVGLLFWGLASTVCACLWFKSRYIPRALAAFGVVSSAFAVACTFVFIMFPRFDTIVGLGWFDTPMGLFDIALSFWLVFKGLKPPEAAGARVRADAV
ncbi:MAG: DUF4386 domain-containing protein [Terracidiphilus sp.]|jgi:hypothetical protein